MGVTSSSDALHQGGEAGVSRTPPCPYFHRSFHHKCINSKRRPGTAAMVEIRIVLQAFECKSNVDAFLATSRRRVVSDSLRSTP